MSGLLSNILLVLLAILELGLLIIIHEGGHFLIARLSGMRVDRFSIGFGPALYKFKRGETTYQIGMLPLGGFVQIAGLNPGDDSISPDDPRAYPNRPVYQRLLTIFAGPATNYLFAALLMALTWTIWGAPMPGNVPVVDDVIAGKPAALAGLQVEDEILSVDGKPVKDMGEVSTLIDGSQGREIPIVVRRGSDETTIKVKPLKDPEGKYRIGIQIGPNTVRVRQSPGTAFVGGLVWPYAQTRAILGSFAEIFRGKQKAEFSGPVGIVSVMKGRIARGTSSAFEIMAMISVYLGLFNLLPLPALDGGRMVFLIAEGLSRRKVNQKLEQMVHTVGVLAFFLFILYITLRNDLPRMFTK